MELRRPYRSPTRDDAARVTARRILDAAERLFVETGYGSTTMSEIARVAQVSKQTVYNTFESKAALLKRLYDVRIVGDDEPIPLAERPEVVRLELETDPHRYLAGFGAVAAQMLTRLGPLLGVVVQGAAAGDPDLRRLMDTGDRERLIGARGWVGHLADLDALRPGIDVERAAEILWAVNNLTTWQLLVRTRGWTADEYGAWLGRAAADLLLAGGDPAGS